MDGPWRIKEFAGRTGVPEATLRAWERRYALLEPTRSDGGYRLYTPDDERRVVAMQAHRARGVATAEAARLARDERPAASDAPQDPGTLVAGLLAAVAAYDASRADALVGAALRRDHADAITEVVLPALRAIGDRWASGELSVAHEHFASHLIERRLLTAGPSWDRGDGPTALLACAPGEHHALGLLCFGLALADRGWRVAYLGESLPIAEVRSAADGLRPDAVVLSATFPDRLLPVAEAVAALAARHRTLVAGPGASEEVARATGAERLTLDPVAAAAAL